MLLAIDIGNTQIMTGVFKEEELLFHARFHSNPMTTPDEYGLEILQLLSAHDINKTQVKDVIISCVVPPLLCTMVNMAEVYLNSKPVIVDGGLKTGIKIQIDNPSEVGADRIVNAVAALKLYGGPVIIVDFGTATTFDAVTKTGEYLGGAIAPGIGISMDALFEKTAMLPRIEIKNPGRAIGAGTVAALQSGVFYGYLGLMENLLRKISVEMEKKPLVVATGGLAELVAGESSMIDEIYPLLTLTGLRIIHENEQGAQ